jgi:hypothetical protein
MQELLDWLEYIEDDRQQRKVRHTLKDILVIVLCFNMKNPWLIITDVSFLFLSFNLHCMLNGRNFQYIRCLEKSIESKER